MNVSFARLFPTCLVIRRTLSVTASPTTAWQALADLPRWPVRDRYIQWVRAVGDELPNAGSWWSVGRQYREQVQRGPFRPVFNLTVVEVDDGRRIAWEAKYLWVRACHAWEVEPREEGCALVSEEVFTGPRLLLAIARLVFRVFSVERMTDRQLEFIATDIQAPSIRN